MLILLAVVMLVGSYIAGNIPLVVSMSEVGFFVVLLLKRGYSNIIFMCSGEVESCNDIWRWIIGWHCINGYYSRGYSCALQ